MNEIVSGNFRFIETEIKGVVVISARQFLDNRGVFSEAYKKPDFEIGGISDVFVQENQSRSFKGVLRGLHYQDKHPQSKLVRVLKGEAFDVAVDLRPKSPTFGKWHGEFLSGENGKQMYLPHGCAHGILAMSEEVIFSYKSDDVYHPEDEAGLIWSDRTIGIEWPMCVDQIILSEKDKHLPCFEKNF